MQTTTGWAWWGGEEAKREWRKGGERGRRISSRGERNVALPRSDRKINRPGGKIKRLQTRREDEPRWFLGSRWSSLRAATEEKNASFEDDTSRYDMDIFRCPFNPCNDWSIFEKEESHWYSHLRQSRPRKPELLTRLCPLLRAATRSRQIHFQHKLWSWSTRFLGVNGKNFARERVQIRAIIEFHFASLYITALISQLAGYYCHERKSNSCNYSTTVGFELAMSHRSVERHLAPQNYFR